MRNNSAAEVYQSYANGLRRGRFPSSPFLFLSPMLPCMFFSGHAQGVQDSDKMPGYRIGESEKKIAPVTPNNPTCVLIADVGPPPHSHSAQNILKRRRSRFTNFGGFGALFLYFPGKADEAAKFL